MKDEPDIVKQLREAERLEWLQSQVQSNYKELEMVEGPSEDVPDETVSFVERDLDEKTRVDDTNYENTGKMLLGAEDRYRLIMEHTSDLIALTTFTLNPIFTYVSPSFKKVLGYGPEDLVGKLGFDFIHPDDKKKLYPLLKKYVSAKAKKLLTGRDLKDSEVIEYRIKDNSGNWHYLKSTANFMGDELLFISKDLAEYEEEEESFQMSEKKLRTIFETATDMITYIDKHGKILDVNRRVEDLLGYKPNEIMGKNFAKLGVLGLKDLPRMANLFRDTIRDDKAMSIIELELKHKNGNKVFVEVGTRFVKKGGKVEGVVNIFRDVTKRRRAEEKLRESEDKYRDLLENANDIIQAVKPDGSFLYVNRAWKKVLGYNEKEIEGLSVFDIIHPNSKEHCMKIFKRIMSGENIEHVEASFLTKDGREINVEGSINCRFEDGKPVSTRGIFRDITKRKQTEEKIKQQSEFLQNTIESLMHPFYVVDVNDFTIKMANSATNLGSLSEKSTCYALTHHENRPCEADEHPCPIEEVKKTKKSVTVEHIHYDKNGNVRNVEVHAHPIFDDKGKVVQIIEYCLDITGRKKAEEELKNSEEKYRNTIEFSPDGILIMNKKGVATSCNTAFLSLTGFSEEEIVGKNALTLLTLTSKSKLKMAGILKTVLKGDILESFDFEWKHKDGSIRIGNAKIGVLKKNDKVQGFQAILRDVTKDRVAQIKMKEYEERYRSLFDKSMDLIYINDFKGNFIDANQACFDLLGYSKDEIKDLNFSKLLDKGQLLKAFKVSKMVRKNGFQNEPVEFKLKCKNGDFVYVEILSSLLYHDGKPVAVQGIARDITERKKAYDTLQESEKRFQDVALSSADWIWEVDKDGRYTFASGKVKEILGYEPSELIGKTPFDLMPEDEAKRVGEIFKEITSEKKPIVDLENLNLSKQGEKVNLLTNGVPLLNESGELIGYRGVDKDITKRKRAEEELKDTHEILRTVNKELEKKVKERTAQVEKLLLQKDEFINQLGHDLKTPLTPLVVLIPLLRKCVGDKPEVIKIVDTLVNSTNHMKNMVDKTLQLAELNSSQIEFEFEETNLVSEINDAIGNNQFLLDENNMDVKNMVDEEIIVQADKSQLYALFTNLFTNAIKYSKDSKGNIVIDAEKGKDDDEVIVSVKDDGIGMTSEQKKFVFDEFYKVDPSRHDLDSSGLGLAICKSIVEHHGGRIWVESPGPGKGCTFYFTLKTGGKKDEK